MIITYVDNLCIKAQVGDTTVSFNPPLRQDGKTPRFASTIALFSNKGSDTNLSFGGGDNTSFIANGPGEYEVGGIFIKGIGIPEEHGSEKFINTLYTVIFDDISLCHLGATSLSDLKPEILEAIGNVDILFVPVTGGNLATPAAGSKLATLLEPRIVIPLYSVDGKADTASLKAFLKEEGEEGTAAADKLTIKKKELESKEEEVAVLSPVL